MEFSLQNILEPFKKKSYLYFLYVWVIFVFIVVFAYFGITSGKIISGLKIAGTQVGGLTIKKASQLLTIKLNPQMNKKVTLVYNNRALSVVPSAVGISIDIPATVAKAYQIGRTGSISNRITTHFGSYWSHLAVKPEFHINQDTLDSFYRLLDATFAVEPIRSVITVNRQGEITFTLSRNGRALDHQRLTQLLENAITKADYNRIEIPIKDVIPPLTETDIQRWGLNQLLGIYSTSFDPSKTDRVQNLKMACAAIDNSLIYPGQSFSFNTWVGPRVPEAGYKEAPVIYLGKLVPGIGGGVCQVSSTLYNAVLLANLKTVQRFNHTLPSAYVPIGRDATVVYGGIDFLFENTNQNPILIVAKVEPTFVTIAISGEKIGWTKVMLETKTIKDYPFSIKEIPDPTIPVGTKLKVQDGLHGSRVELWRQIVQATGQMTKELVNTSIYPAQPEEYKIGTSN